MRNKIILILGILALSACKRKLATVKLQDKDLIIQVRQEDAVDDTTKIAYQVRIFNQMKLAEQDSRYLTEKMEYDQDSSFYKKKGLNKVFPVGVIPIANGIKNCYEYVVLFDKSEMRNAVGAFIFDAKEINGKNYQLSIN
ncbi:hypothetical protein [Pedobacter sp. MW01-1-1]|uniref:hypothetical protein n=1 Tax=Pedobacter sp. MW01-1-1 TaxID=3383027 RepID=UPI003FEF1BEF